METAILLTATGVANVIVHTASAPYRDQLVLTGVVAQVADAVRSSPSS